jgi:hypothetical protein
MKYKLLLETMQLLAANVGSQETKVQKKLVKIHAKLKEVYEVYADKMADLKLEHASVDEKGNVIVNEKGDYQFSKDAMKKLNADIRSLLEEDFYFTNIEIMNPKGLEEHVYLKPFVSGVDFIKEEEI